MSSSPVSSPAAPAGGCRVAAAMPVMRQRVSARDHSSSSQPWVTVRGRGRMGRGQAGQGGGVVAQLGVVFHGARPERVGAQVDRVLPVGQAGDVGDQVPLGDLGQRDRLVAQASRPGPARSASHSGTPVVRNDQARRPGLEYSKMVGSWSRPMTRGAGGPAARSGPGQAAGRAPAAIGLMPSPHHLFQGRRRNRRSPRGSAARSPRPAGRRRRLGTTPPSTPDRHAGQETLLGHASHHRLGRHGQGERELAKRRGRRQQRHPGMASAASRA